MAFGRRHLGSLAGQQLGALASPSCWRDKESVYPMAPVYSEDSGSELHSKQLALEGLRPGRCDSAPPVMFKPHREHASSTLILLRWGWGWAHLRTGTQQVAFLNAGSSGTLPKTNTKFFVTACANWFQTPPPAAADSSGLSSKKTFPGWAPGQAGGWRRRKQCQPAREATRSVLGGQCSARRRPRACSLPPAPPWRAGPRISSPRCSRSSGPKSPTPGGGGGVGVGSVTPGPAPDARSPEPCDEGVPAPPTRPILRIGAPGQNRADIQNPFDRFGAGRGLGESCRQLSLREPFPRASNASSRR